MKSWLTSLFGLGAGALNLLANGTNWKQILFSVAVSGLGFLAKDFNVTGGTVPQSSSTQASNSPHSIVR